MFLKLAYLLSKLRFSGKYLFLEYQISAGQLSTDSSSTETLYCLNSLLPDVHAPRMPMIIKGPGNVVFPTNFLILLKV